jgi:anthranilate synthase/aminodeoxychorismate synthase-like glutamine amidotransferase
MRVLVIDNYDSFTYNLVQYLGELGSDPMVLRNDALEVEEIRELKPKRIVISPGPGNPDDVRDFGICAQVLKEISPAVPTLGVCLGHQGIAVVFGGRVGPAENIRHGKTSRIYHDGCGVFRQLPNGFRAGRYHSLAVDRGSLPRCLEVSAVSEQGEIMAIRHRCFPIEGVQFHPESILTEYGHRLISNFLEDSGHEESK